MFANSVTKKVQRVALGAAGVLLASAGVAQAAGWFSASSGGAASSLAQAHDAFLSRDFKSMTKLVHGVLADRATDRVERKNALALINRAFAENGGRLPADWSLPEPLTNLKFKHIRKEIPDGIEYSYALAVNGPALDSVTSLKVVRFPDTVVLDRATNVGEWTVEPDDGSYYFEIYGGDAREPLEDGLYTFQITQKDGTVTNGWFPMERLTSSASPVLHQPEVGQSYAHGKPEIRWDDFRSPEYQASERRILAVDVGLLSGPNYEWKGVWGFYQADSNLTSVVVGDMAEATGVSELEDGKYWLSLTYHEQRTFGDMKLRRGSRTARPFYVRTAQ